MRSKSTITILALALLSLFSCERDLINEEQYKAVIYLKSDDNNITQYPHMMNDSISTGYITAGSGGSMPLTKDVMVGIEVDAKILEEYNYRNFGEEYGKYVRLLPQDCFVLPYTKMAIKAGNPASTVYFPLEVDANRLSPDSTYMLPVKIVSTDGVEVNTDKEFVLYRVALMNRYTSPTSDYYKMRGIRLDEAGIKSNITTNKRLVPLSRNRVRLFPETIIASTDMKVIQDRTIVLIIQEDNTVLVRPFKNITVEQQEDCSYDPEEMSFTLNYRYHLPGSTDWITVQETLTRIE